MARSEVKVSDGQFAVAAEAGFAIVPYRELPAHHREAIAWFMAIDCHIWPLTPPGKPKRTIPMDELDSFMEECRRSGRNPQLEAFRAALPRFLVEYGDVEYGVASIPTATLQARVVEMLDSSPRLRGMGWDDYHRWYLAKTAASGDDRMRDWPDEDRWPVFFSAADSVVLDDGWHRFHSYSRSGHSDVPAVFLPSERHREFLACPPGPGPR